MWSSNQKGAVAELKLAAAAAELGIPVLRPMSDHSRYDLVFEMGGRLLRVQAKWGALDRSKCLVTVSIRGSYFSPQGYVLSTYAEHEIDLLGVYCGELDRCYLLPAPLIAGRRAIWLRLEPPRNGQRACINLACDYEFAGAVAQWEERGAGSAEAVGSNPTSSTPSSDGGRTIQTVGAHVFRNHFGYYMERGAAGDEILVTRRGRPSVRLTAA